MLRRAASPIHVGLGDCGEQTHHGAAHSNSSEVAETSGALGKTMHAVLPDVAVTPDLEGTAQGTDDAGVACPTTAAVPQPLREAWPRLKVLFADSSADVERLAAAVADAPGAAAARAVAAAAVLRRHSITAALVLRATDAELAGVGVPRGAVLAMVRMVAGELCSGAAAAGLSHSERLLLSAPLRDPGTLTAECGHRKPGFGVSAGSDRAAAKQVASGAQLTLTPLRPKPLYDRAAELRAWAVCVHAGRRRQRMQYSCLRTAACGLKGGSGRVDVCGGGGEAAAERGRRGSRGFARCVWRTAADGGEEGAGERLCDAILTGDVKYGRKEVESWRIEELNMSAVYDLDADGNLVIVRT